MNLQEALDNGNVEVINQLMPELFPDYIPEYANILMAYNKECSITAKDLITFRYKYPRIPIMYLFILEPEEIKKRCTA